MIRAAIGGNNTLAERSSGDDLTSMLGQMSEQIAEAERRHQEQMRAMQQRLSELGGKAERARADLGRHGGSEPAYKEADRSLARIGDGMAGLAARTAQPVVAMGGDDEWDMAAAEALTRMYEADAPGADNGVPAFFFQDPVAVEDKIEAPVAMKPAAVVAPVMHDVDPVMFALTDAVEPQTPMAAVMPGAMIASAVSHAAVAAAAPAIDNERLSAMQDDILAALARDRDWVDQRLLDIASRVEQSLSSINPIDRITELGTRFSAFEERFDEAMSGVATRADLSGLQQIEAQIGQLSRQWDETSKALSRIDGIETELRKLTVLAEQAQSVEMPEDAAGIVAQPMPDLSALVDSAAERVAARFAAQQPTAPAIDTSRFDEMRSLLNAMADERRRDEHQTNSMLDTMQEALVRLIDRVDRFEPTAAGAPVAAAAFAPAQAADMRGPDGVVYVENERGAHPGRRESDHEAYQQSGVKRPDMDPHDVQMPAASAGFEPTEPLEPALHETAEEAPVAPKARQPRATTALPPRQRVPEKMVTAAAAAAAAPPPPTAKASQPRATRSLPQGTVIAMPDETSETVKPESSLAKRGIMVASIGVAVIALGFLFEVFIKDRLLSNGVPKLGERVPVARPMTLPASPSAAPSMAPQFDDEADNTVSPAKEGGAGALPTQPAPREAPAPMPSRGAVEQPSSIQQPRPRSQLETSTEQPSHASADAGGPITTASTNRAGGPPAATPGMAGITLQHPASMPIVVPTAMGARSPMMAAPAAAAVAPVAAPAAAPVGASPGGITTSALAKPQRAPMDNLTAAASGMAELPPALIGPLSMRLAAQKGDPEAQFEVAVRFAEGKGVKQDFKQAMAWYERSAKSGFVPSQYRLATLFERGVGGAPDLATASQWYQRAAGQGNVKAMHNLAVLSASADGGKSPDYISAAQWFAAAAGHGLADSQFNLGVLYENGLGVPRDPVAAYKWYALAAAKGDAEAGRRRDATVARLQPAQVKAAEAEVTGWRSKPINSAANDARSAGAALRARSEQMAAAAEAQSEEAAAVAAPTPVKRSVTKQAGRPSVN